MPVNTETLTIAGRDGSFAGFFAAPESASAAGVIVIQEIFGVNSHIRAVTERFAEAGYAALAPDIFWRKQPGIELGYSTQDIARGRELKAAMNTDEVIEDLRAAFATLASQRQCQGRKCGVVGYCYGGLLAYVAAARLHPACASSYYGGGIVDYLDEVDKLDCPIQFHFGEQDSAIPLDQVEQVRAATRDKADAEVFVYKGAGHGFHCDQRGSYDEHSAAIAWERTLALFSEHLKA